MQLPLLMNWKHKKIKQLMWNYPVILFWVVADLAAFFVVVVAVIRLTKPLSFEIQLESDKS